MRTLCTLICAASLSSCAANPIQATVRSPKATVEELGYTAVALPSTAYGPGSLVTSLKGNGLQSPLKLTYLCNPEYTHVPPPRTDVAATSEATRAFGGNFRLDATALKQLGLGAGADYVENVDLSFRNVRIEQLALDDLEMVRHNLGDGCTGILRKYSRQNLAYQTQQAIRADVVYRVRLKRGLSAEAKGIALKPFILQFGGSVQEETGTTFSGEGLYHGLVLMKV